MFFSESHSKPLPIIAKCGACGLSKKSKDPKVKPIGEGRKRVLIIAEYPGKTTMIQDQLFQIGIDMLRDCWVTNAIICHPGKNKVTSEHLSYCLPNLLNTITELEPNVIIPLGDSAINSIIGYSWNSPAEGFYRWVGLQIPSQKPNAWICPTYHPAYLTTKTNEKDKALPRLMRGHLKKAFSLKEKPHKSLPDYPAQIQIIKSPEEAARTIRQMIKKGGVTAFDFEADRLKPDSKKSTILSCSICWRGKITIAYPWVGEAVEATKEYFQSEACYKIASNLKFEERWVMRHTGVKVKKWFADTMLLAHILDTRMKTHSIKFQSYAMLGQPYYANAVESFISATEEGANNPNRLHKVPIDKLLLYNGLDSLLEYEVAIKQIYRLQEVNPNDESIGRLAEVLGRYAR